jgi:uncharacterized membrane protein YqaE (UPF0057 family)
LRGSGQGGDGGQRSGRHGEDGEQDGERTAMHGGHDTGRMKYLLAILLPPLGLLAVGRVGQAVLCLILWITIIGWPLAALWALLVVNSAETESRMRRLLDEERRRRG